MYASLMDDTPFYVCLENWLHKYVVNVSLYRTWTVCSFLLWMCRNGVACTAIMWSPLESRDLCVFFDGCRRFRHCQSRCHHVTRTCMLGQSRDTVLVCSSHQSYLSRLEPGDRIDIAWAETDVANELLFRIGHCDNGFVHILRDVNEILTTLFWLV